jgi:two-component system sensor histidine kinase/response regulator
MKALLSRNGHFRTLAPLGVCLLLVLLSLVALRVIDQREAVGERQQLEIYLHAASDLALMWQQGHQRAVRGMANLPELHFWFDNRSSAADSAADATLRALYQAQGYLGHGLYDGQLRPLGSHGLLEAPAVVEAMAPLLQRAQHQGASLGHLAGAHDLLVTCARIPLVGLGGHGAPVLCLRLGSEQSLKPNLDRQASPFMRVFALDHHGHHSPPAGSEAPDVTGLSETDGRLHYLEPYQNSRGEWLIGAALWLEELNLGLVAERHTDAPGSAYPLSRNLILALCGLAIFLVLWLTLRARRDRQRLAEREMRYRQVLDHLPLAVRIRDLQGRLRLENRMARSTPQIAQWNDLDLHSDSALPPLGQAVRDAQRGVLAYGKPQDQQIELGDSQAPGYAAFRVMGFPIHDLQGDLRGLGSLAVEETAQARDRHALAELAADLERQVQERTAELVAAKDQAEAATRAKANFLANMSHEIRSPLNAVVGLTHLAKRQTDEPRLTGYLDKILRSSEHLLEVVGDILDFSKIEARKMQIERVDFSLQRLVSSVVDMVWERARGKQLQLTVDIDARLPAQFLGDPLRIMQILINFMDNAIKFTHSGSISLRVLLEERSGDDYQLCFEVQDSGIGMPAERVDEMLQPFQQMDDSTSRRYGGTGLGLAICSQLAGLLGGRLVIRSVLGQGSLFGLVLKLQAADGAAPGEAGDGPQGLPLQDRHVLLVEDDALNREVAGEQLAALGLRVSLSCNGVEALQRLQDDASIDLVLMDVQMPTMDGLETVRRLRPLHPELPVIALTASSLSGDRERCLEAGMSDYLAKPVNPHHLEAVLERWLGRSIRIARAQPTSVAGAMARPALPAIDGLDQRAALERLLDNGELYHRLLVRFVEDCGQTVAELQGHLAEQRHTDAQALLHRLRALVATLGAERLEALCLDLEIRLRGSDAWQECHAAFVTEFARLHQAIRSALEL